MEYMRSCTALNLPIPAIRDPRWSPDCTGLVSDVVQHTRIYFLLPADRADWFLSVGADQS